VGINSTSDTDSVDNNFNNIVMIETKKILDSIKDKILFEPIDDRVLIKPLKYKMVKKTVRVPEKVVNTVDGAEHEETKMIEHLDNVPANCQLGVVLKKGTGTVNAPYEEGDIIVYPINAGMAFELFRDSRLLKRYEILGKWSTLKS
jgi:hypothetical protein